MPKAAAKKKTTTRTKYPPVKEVLDAAEAVAETKPTHVNGAEIVPATSTVPTFNFALQAGVEDLVAIGIVHVENSLGPQLEQTVAEHHRLGQEINTRSAELLAIYNMAPAGNETLAERCEVLVKAADELKIRLGFELTKSNFNPDSLHFNVVAQFTNGMTTPPLDCVIENERAEELVDEIAILRRRQSEAGQLAAQLKNKLNPQWLHKQLRAAIATNAMNASEVGAATVDALRESIDKALKLPTFKQLMHD